MNEYIIKIARMKASQSNCRYKISAIGFNHKGEMICSSFNKKRFYRKGGGIHAEMELMSDYGKYLKTIIKSLFDNTDTLFKLIGQCYQ
jgi:hypothetical protein